MNRNILKNCFFLVILFISHFMVCSSQEKGVDNMVNYMRHAMLFNQLYPQEKVYLHFDNTGYFKGETMWFKAYVVRTDQMKLSDISHVLYVELLNPSGDVVEKRKLKIEDGMANGDIELDSIFGSGFYEVRAYTRYMLNWGKNAVFSRVFPIFNKPQEEGDYSKPVIDKRNFRNQLPPRIVEVDSTTQLSPASQKIRKARGYTVRFYPEGGKIVRGLRSRVAFEVLNKEMCHVAAKGILTDEDGHNIGFIEAGKDGKGIFEITPESNKILVVLTDEDGKKHEFELDSIGTRGCTMQLDAIHQNNPIARVHSSADMLGRLMGYCVIGPRGSILAADTLKVAEEMEIELDRSTMQPGVNQLTLFTADGHIEAERLFFISPEKRPTYDTISLSSPTEKLRPCCPIKIELSTLPNASISFSAMDAATMTNGKQGNIWTWMLLSSDLKGYIPHPEYYFEADDEQHRMAADSLMLFNGWRRYDWNVMADIEPWKQKIQQVEDQLYIFGKLKPSASNLRKNHPVAGVDLTVYMYNEKGEHLRGETTTDSLGNYAFKLPDINGEWNMQIVTRIGEKLKSYTVSIDRQFRPETRYISTDETSQLEANQANMFRMNRQTENADDDIVAIETGKHEFVTPTVNVKAKKRYFTDDSKVTWYDESYGRNHAALYYDCDAELEDIIDRGEDIPDIYEFLAGKNNLFKYTKGEELFLEGKVRSNNPILSGTYNGNVINWILNNQVYDKFNSIFFGYDPGNTGIQPFPTFLDEVKSIYISDKPAATGSMVGIYYDITTKDPVVNQGIMGINNSQYETTIFIYTHPTYSSESKKGRRNTYFQGFNTPLTFQMEDYSKLPPMEDFRRTIYWNPSVTTDGNGHATINFFNNSSCKEMFISAEGITKDGRFILYH